jgi:hypothetical protein
MAEDSAAATDSAAMVISMAVDSAAGVSSTVAAEADPVVVAASTAAARAEADIADRASTFGLCTNGWRLRQPFFSPISHLQKSASTQSAQKANQHQFLLGCCSGRQEGGGQP